MQILRVCDNIPIIQPSFVTIYYTNHLSGTYNHIVYSY